MTDCLVCAQIAAEHERPGGFLVSGGQVLAYHAFEADVNPTPYRGHLLVVTRRHTPGFEDLTADEAGAVGMAIAALTRALRATGAEHVYVARVGNRSHHLHVHLLPRWPGTPADVPWHGVDEWEGAPRGGFDETAAFASSLASELEDA